LTQSSFLQTVYSIEDSLLSLGDGDFESLEDVLDSAIGDIETLYDECQTNLEAMPEHLQSTSTSGEMLTERIELLQQWQEELESKRGLIEDEYAEFIDEIPTYEGP
jgi:hypothetical protein